ncbi:Xanthine phosphoribosyltransferase [uncultured archaeon]|nr:Xanthine phosphoribosyltransferase [uncultured archaeon]
MEKSKESIKCYIVSWDEAYRLAKIIANKIKRSGFKPDLVIGIARGGLVPARTVCDFLLHKDLTSIKVEHWGIAATLGKARMKFPLPAEIEISGKNILIVDDVADTGDTYSLIMDYLKEKNPAEVRTAVLQYKTCSKFVPDYWGEKLDEWEWIIYPWALFEDMTGFIGKVLAQPGTAEDIRKSLKNLFNISIPRKDLLDMLNMMHLAGKVRKRKPGKKVIWDILMNNNIKGE